MLNLDLFAGRPTPGAPDRVKSWSVVYPFADGDYTLPRPKPPGPPAWLGSGPYCNYAHGRGVEDYRTSPHRLTNPAFTSPPPRED